MPKFNQIYLKCNYDTEGAPHIMPWEYIITFNSRSEKNPKVVLPEGDWPQRGRDWMIVQKDNIKQLNEKEGLVRIAYIQKIDKKSNSALVRINNLDGCNSFLVPLEDIVKQ